MSTTHDDACSCCSKWRWAMQAIIDDANARIVALADQLAARDITINLLRQEVQLTTGDEPAIPEEGGT